MPALAPEIKFFAGVVGQPLGPFEALDVDANKTPRPCSELARGTKRIVIYFTVENGAETIEEVAYINICYVTFIHFYALIYERQASIE